MCTQFLLKYFQNSQYSVLTRVLFLSTRFIPGLRGVYEQQRHRPPCASTRSNQGICYLLIWKYHIISKLATGEISSFLVVSVAETHFVGKPKDRLSHIEVHIHGLQFLSPFMFTKLVKRCSLYSLLFWYRFCKLKNYSWEHYKSIKKNSPPIYKRQRDSVSWWA